MKNKVILVLACCAWCVSSFSQIQHVEPLNWWVGMKEPLLQVMVHGKGIGETTPSVSYPGVSLVKVHKAESPNYLFIDLNITPNAKPGTLLIKFSKNGNPVTTHSYQLLARGKGSAERTGFDASDVICLVTPDRFVNGDPSNDVVPGMKESKVDRSNLDARHGGDIRGMINSLDYLKGMGFTAIWPQPLLENNSPNYSYHGYAITDHYKVDPRFGTLDEYKELSREAAKKGIKLVFDGVVNHIGTGYWWMDDKPFRNWLNYQDSAVMTTHQRTVNQDPYASRYDKDLMTKGWFVPTMPDVNSDNPYMARYLIQNTIWWIETLNLGGLRQDTYSYSSKTFLKNWSCAIMKEYPNFNMVGEEWSLNPLLVAYWQQGKRNEDGYVSCLRTTMDFPLQTALVEAFREKDDPNFAKGLNRLYTALANDFNYADPRHLMVFGDNHDMDRLHTQLGNDPFLTKMAMAYLATTRGILQVYYGTELLMENSRLPGNHGLIRSDFPGGWKEDKVNAFTGEGLSDEQKDMQSYMRKLLNYRKSSSLIPNGKLLHFSPTGGVYVYFRYDDRKTLMVVLNKNRSSARIDLKRFREILARGSNATDVISGEKKQLLDQLEVGPGASLLEIAR